MSILITIAGGYCIILLLMFLFQNNLLFMPVSGMMQTPESVGLHAEDIWVETEDGVKLHAWYFPHEESDRVIVLSHGNAGNISFRIDIARTLLAAGAAVLMYDYRGYGQSEGRPTEEGLYKDITAFMEYLKNEKGYPEQNVFMYGRSLGAAVAAYAATKYNLGGLVLDSAFKSLRAMIRDVYPFVPSSLARYEFPTETYLRQLKDMPVMIMHSPSDEIVGFHNSQYLYEIANEPKQFIELQGGHNDSFYISRDQIEKSWREFLKNAGKNSEEMNRSLGAARQRYNR